MARINWGVVGERFFETGIDRGVLYVPSQVGVAWNGLTSVSENPTGGDEKAYYLDGIKYLAVPSKEEYKATVTALSSPKEFDACDGMASPHNGLLLTHQRRRSFGLSYRSLIGNDTQGVARGYLLHLVYNALAAPSATVRRTLNDVANPIEFSWSIATRPPAVTGFKPTAHIVIDSRTTNPDILAEIEDLLYGTESTDAALPTPDELITIFTP